MTVRSACFARGSVAHDTAPAVYTVPAGQVLLFKSAYFRPNGTGSWALNVYIASGTPTALITLHQLATGTQTRDQWDGWIVLNPTDAVQINPITLGCDYWLSGALLPYNTAL